MHRITLVIVAAAGLVTITPGAEQHAWAAVPSAHQSVGQPAMSAESIKELQTKLSEKGFSPGPIDGLWGPDTAGSLSRFQAAKGLKASGRMDRATVTALESIGVAAGAPAGVPQVAATPATDASGMATAAPVPAAGSSPGASAGGGNAASGNDNQAVATTSADASQPAHGANSFSEGEAGRRIAGHGFQNVSGLRKDENGVWRATADKDGQHVQVWLDYKGNVGQQ